MNNKEYINLVSQRTGYSNDLTQKYVRAIIEHMSATFDQGEGVRIDGFGTFELKNRMERIVVNPATGRRMMVPPKIVLGFKPSSVLKDKLRNSQQ